MVSQESCLWGWPTFYLFTCLLWYVCAGLGFPVVGGVSLHLLEYFLVKSVAVAGPARSPGQFFHVAGIPATKLNLPSQEKMLQPLLCCCSHQCCHGALRFLDGTSPVQTLGTAASSLETPGCAQHSSPRHSMVQSWKQEKLSLPTSLELQCRSSKVWLSC